MILYTCGAKKSGANWPVVVHPCAVATKALDEAGLPYELRVVGGYRSVPFSRRGKRQAIIDLTGQQDVPVLVHDDGSFVVGSKQIAAWAHDQPR